MNHDRYFTFQTIIDITGACGVISFDTVGVGSPLFAKKKLSKTKIL